MARKTPRIPTFAELGVRDAEVEELRRSIAQRAAARKQQGTGSRAARASRSIEIPPLPRRRSGKGARGQRIGVLQPPPLGGLRGLLTVVALFVAAWLSSSWRSMPTPVPEGAPDTVFSSGRAMQHIVEIASEARPTGSPAHTRARAYLIDELRALGLDPAVQIATPMRPGARSITTATVHNIVARLPGSGATGRAVLATAHYDSRGIAPGAADAGIGVAAILEAMRTIRTGPALQNDLVVLFTDAEEIGLLGAQAFVQEHPWMDNIAVVISLEMRGGGGPSTMFETGSEGGWAIEALAKSGAPAWANSLTDAIYRRMPNDTDFTRFREVGVQGLNFAGIGRANLYHQQYDAPDNISEATLQHHGQSALALLRHLGDADLTQVNAPTRVYLWLPYIGIVSYSASWVRGVAAATVGAWALLFLVVIWRGTSIFAVLAGLLAALVHLAAMGGIGFLLLQWRMGAHPETGALQAGLFHREQWYVLTLVALAFALAMPIVSLVRKSINANELALGALLIPVGLMAGLTATAPLGAMNLQGPTIAACLGAAALLGVRPGRHPGFLRWLAVVVMAIPVLAVLVPIVEGVWMAMGMEFAPVLAVLIGVVVILLLPALEVMREPRGWWVGLGATALAAIFLVMGIVETRPSAERPAPSTLVYAMDRPLQAAWWGTDPTRATDHPGSLWAASVAGSFGTDSPPDSLRSFTGGRVGYATAVAEMVEIAAPRVVLADASEEEAGAAGMSPAADPLGPVPNGAFRVVLGSVVEAEMMRIEFPESGIRPFALNGRPIPAEGAQSLHIEHWGAGRSGVALDFPSSAPDSIGFVVIEHLLRPGEVPGLDRFVRPPELAPDIVMMSDRAMIRTGVTILRAEERVLIGGS